MLKALFTTKPWHIFHELIRRFDNKILLMISNSCNWKQIEAHHCLKNICECGQQNTSTSSNTAKILNLCNESLEFWITGNWEAHRKIERRITRERKKRYVYMACVLITITYNKPSKWSDRSGTKVAKGFLVPKFCSWYWTRFFKGRWISGLFTPKTIQTVKSNICKAFKRLLW